MVDYCAARHDAPLVVRFNGGPQSARHVVHPTAATTLSTNSEVGCSSPKFAPLFRSTSSFNPFSLMKEANAGKKGNRYTQERLFIDPECLIVTPYHQYANRIQELVRGANRHGSTGDGVVETRRDALLWGTYIQVKDILSDAPALGMLDDIRVHKLKQLPQVLGRQQGSRRAVD